MHAEDLFVKRKPRASFYSNDAPPETPPRGSRSGPGDADHLAPAGMRGNGDPRRVGRAPSFDWKESLPEDVQPHELLRSYAPIADVLARHWDDPAATRLCFARLLGPGPGSGPGLSKEVRLELLALRQFYFSLELERYCARTAVAGP